MEKIEIFSILTGYAGNLFAQVRVRSVHKAAVRTGTHYAQCRGYVLLAKLRKAKI